MSFVAAQVSFWLHYDSCESIWCIRRRGDAFCRPYHEASFMHAVSGSRQRITRSMSKERLDEHPSMLNDAKAPRKVTVSTRKSSCVLRDHHVTPQETCNSWRK